MKYLVSIVVTQYPSLSFLTSYIDTISDTVTVAVNTGFMLYCGSLFTEYLYGITRLRNKAPIGLAHKCLSILAECVLPIVLSSERIPCVGLLKRVLAGLDVAFALRYAIVAKATFPSFLSYALGISFGKIEAIGAINTSTATAMGWLLKHGSLALYLAFKLIQWYYVYEASGNVQAPIAKIPAPDCRTYLKVPKDRCAICGQLFRDPVCIDTSGCCFCYMCIYRHLQKTRTCPVTGIHTEVGNIRKLRLS